MFLKPLCCSEWTNQRVTDNTIDPVSHWPSVPWFDLEALEFSFVINTHWNCEKICCLHTFCHWILHIRPAVEVKWFLAFHPNNSYRENYEQILLNYPHVSPVLVFSFVTVSINFSYRYQYGILCRGKTWCDISKSNGTLKPPLKWSLGALGFVII